ncbi:MAG: DegT/DnrJ/EryC1/StrS family aminotransferase [Chitinispirillales bacterium]|nr:DegT/DnrJ/EryC1/StrS family aminotransferase [Chitinispirillales bacterium]
MTSPCQQIHVTSPLLPSLEELIPCLRDIWERKWLTNNGHYHQLLEKALGEYLGVEHLSLFTNGTLTLTTALQAMQIKGEVITTPYSFVATAHSIRWNGLTPVFVDIEEKSCNIDPEQIERAITPLTTAIMPVHVYGNPCDIEAIQSIANRYGLAVIYDSAHAFGVKVNGGSILNFGDMNSLSFHATKVYNTLEGGALVLKDHHTKECIDYLKNFGFEDEVTVVMSGINSKMDEMRAAYGLLNLKGADDAITKRKRIAETYRTLLRDVKGISYFDDLPGVIHNYSYFPVFVNEKEYGMSRDGLYEKLQRNGIFGRRYFYPLISDFSVYRELPSSAPERLPVARKMSKQVICLPIYADLKIEEAERVAGLCLKNLKK